MILNQFIFQFNQTWFSKFSSNDSDYRYYPWFRSSLKYKAIKTDLEHPEIQSNKCESIYFIKKHHIFENVTSGFCAYFVHSYRMNIYSMDQCFGTTLYGESFPSVVINKNVIGMQFHPEKSQKNGLKLLKNFLNLMPVKKRIIPLLTVIDNFLVKSINF